MLGSMSSMQAAVGRQHSGAGRASGMGIVVKRTSNMLHMQPSPLHLPGLLAAW